MFWECVGYVLGMFWKRFGDSFGQACLGVVLGMFWAYFWHVLGMDRRYFRHVLSKFGHVLGMILACSGDDSGMFPGCFEGYVGHCSHLCLYLSPSQICLKLYQMVILSFYSSTYLDICYCRMCSHCACALGFCFGHAAQKPKSMPAVSA